MIFISQPVGVGFSYQEEAIGSYNDETGGFQNTSQANATGRWPILDPVDVGTINTTDLAAMATWHVLQGFLSGAETLGAQLGGEKIFNLWTESYGGHYGPAFYHYFYTQNELIRNGTIPGYALNFNSLGIGNGKSLARTTFQLHRTDIDIFNTGIIDEAIQAGQYPEFAVNNTYGIKAYNDSIYSYAITANTMPNGCLAQISNCILTAQSLNGGYVDGKVIVSASKFPSLDVICSEAQDICRDNVEGVYYNFGGRGVYDIRHPHEDATPPDYFVEYLNLPHVQDALGVNLNYTDANNDIYWEFQVREKECCG
jgi:hypothetical protein